MLFRSILTISSLAYLVLASPIDTSAHIAARQNWGIIDECNGVCCPAGFKANRVTMGKTAATFFEVAACCPSERSLNNILDPTGMLMCGITPFRVADPQQICDTWKGWRVCGDGHTRACCLGTEHWDAVDWQKPPPPT